MPQSKTPARWIYSTTPCPDCGHTEKDHARIRINRITRWKCTHCDCRHNWRRDGLDQQPSTTCYCGGHIAWQEYPDRWQGSCHGECGSYVTKLKIFPTETTAS